VLWAASSGFTRLSLLCFYYRLTEHIFWRRYKIILHLTVAASAVFSIAYIIALCFACRPVSALWGNQLHPQCIRISDFLFITAVITTILEFVVAILPVPVIFSLEMDRNQQWSVACLLSMGILTTLAGCVRTYYVYKGWVNTYDYFWWAEPHWISSGVENSVAIVCSYL
jgi:hypothetical protein